MNIDVIKEYISRTTNDCILNTLYKHKCYDLLMEMPDSIYKEKAYIRYLKNKRRALVYIEETSALVEKLNIPYAIMKGIILSQTAYGNPFIRTFGDIDFLISGENINTFKDIAKQCGFVQGELIDGKIVPVSREKRIYQTVCTHQLLPFIKLLDNKDCPVICLDINTNAIWGECKTKLNSNELLCFCENTKVFDLTVNKLQPVIEFILLCLHHYKDMNSIYLLSQGSLKLRLFLDIFRYIQNNHSAVSPIILRKESIRLGVLPYVYYCIKQTDYLFPDNRLKAYCDILKSESGEQLLDKFGLSDAERKTWNISLEERLFSPYFLSRFYNLLNSEDIRKININLKMMH